MQFDPVDQLYTQFAATCQTYLPHAICQRIEHAYHFARDAHGDQTRKSGEPYITHPISVAHYMAQMYVDESVLIGALLHDVAEDTHITLDDIEAQFGAQARHLVDGVTHLRNVSQLEDIAHLFLAMAGDVRVMLIKLYDRLHNMQTLGFMPTERRRRKALETLRVYIPLAAKLGMWELKTELETLILQQLDPEAHNLICAGLAARYAEQEPKLKNIAETLQSLLRQKGIPCGYRLKQRSPYRIYEAMTGSKLDDDAFNQAFQVIIQVDSLPECYLALGYIHDRYPHVTGSLTDSIGNPRDTFYRSLSTSIIAQHYLVNLRIRTYEFDRLSEIGILAQIQFAAADQEKQPRNAPWLPQLPQIYRESEDAQKFVESVFQDILQKHIVCFTPRGDEISLPRGATVLDFAYHVHTQIGHECRGAVVNGKPADFSYKLADGDHVEIIRSPKSAPYHEWLDDTLGYATTSTAKRRIREWFRKQDSEILIRKGRNALRDERLRLNTSHVTAQMIAEDLKLDSPRTLYLQIGNGTLPISDIARAMLKHMPNLFTHVEREFVEVTDLYGQTGLLAPIAEKEIRLGRCCQPHIGDSIIAHVKDNHTIAVIHRTNCRNVMRGKRTETMIRIDWLASTDPFYLVYLRLEGFDRGGLMRDVSVPIADLGANIALSDAVKSGKTITMRLKLELQNQDDLIRIIHRLAALQNITLVQCMDTAEITQWEQGFNN